MTVMQNMRPALYAARLFGCVPYSITSTSLVLSKIGVLHSLLCIVCYAWMMYLFTQIPVRGSTKRVLLIVTRSCISLASTILEVLITVISNRRFPDVLSKLQRYDTAVGLDNVQSFALVSRVTVLIPFLFEIYTGYLLTATTRLHWLMIVVNMVTSISQSYGVLKFAVVLSILLQKFRHLNKRLVAESTFAVLVKNPRAYRKLQIRNACRLHECLVSAAEEVNSLYSLQLLAWLASMAFAIVTGAFVFIAQLGTKNDLKMLLDLSWIAWSVVKVIVITTVCHLTSAEANKIRTTIFSPNSVALRRSNSVKDDLEIGQYFQSRQLNFSALAGLIVVDLPLLLSMAGAVTTYLVILTGN